VRAGPPQRAALNAAPWALRRRPGAEDRRPRPGSSPLAPGALPRAPLPEWRAMSSKSAKNKPSSASAQGSGSRRNAIIAAVVAAVVAIAVVAVIVAGGGDDDDTASSSNPAVALAGTTETKELFQGVKQNGDTIGEADAPVTMYEFIDYQCPFCRQFRLGAYPQVVTDNVKSGKLKIVSRPLTFIGPESEKAARAAAAAGEQNKEADFTQLFYFNQGEENAGYVTDEFIDKIYDAAGVDKAKANAFRKSVDSRDGITTAANEAEKYGVVSTPTFVIGESGGPYEKLEVDINDAAAIKAAVDSLAGGAN
jgi:protein-disulfide isomerase